MTSKQLKRARRQLGMSQAQLARRLKVDTITVSRWERGVRAISPIVEVALEYVKLTHKEAA